ncbi:hypothetical protein KDA14_05805, partial [Candidatus Saccharibacteria bacterium]|nr:hypothetical protein [Candidatus Saccharibacteria bacterium]
MQTVLTLNLILAALTANGADAQRIRAISTVDACVVTSNANGFLNECDDTIRTVTTMLLAVPP